MSSSSNDVHHMMDENSARFHPKRGWLSRGPRQPERRIKAAIQQDSAVVFW
ncbi:unnamed protein product [Protopolystoma xenopodis]|uniref:Uncharacterized protein n=1 Tax=Protopolystoma xenopodis TaxID=117903 RepID=A0A448X769_9PLAT|nr:unnamed protein product [Protopolystoma xenopodis]